MTAHAHWMQRCLDLAQQGAGRVSPNPMVGSVIVGGEGETLGEGFHGRFGGPHAEVEAFHDAEERGFGGRFSEASLYVNLEPCNYHGKTPPCAGLILEKQISRVIVGMEDPSPHVAGGGIARLREAGVEVTVGVLEGEAKRLNEAFVHHVATGRPLVTLKIAQTLDGKVGTLDSGPLMVSSLESRALVHRWRSELDAVLVGAGTAKADDPQLTVRHPTFPPKNGAGQAAEGRQPVRVVLDRTGELPPSLRLFSDEHVSKTVAVTGELATPAYETGLLANGGCLIRAPETDGHLDLPVVLEILGSGDGLGRPVQSVLVEAGPGLATALLQHGLVDRLFVFTSPDIIGEGVPAFLAWDTEPVSFADVEWERVGDDVLFRGFLRNV